MRTPEDHAFDLERVCNAALELCGPGYRAMTIPALFPHRVRTVIWDVISPNGLKALCEEWPEEIGTDEMALVLASALQGRHRFDRRFAKAPSFEDPSPSKS